MSGAYLICNYTDLETLIKNEIEIVVVTIVLAINLLAELTKCYSSLLTASHVLFMLILIVPNIFIYRTLKCGLKKVS